MNLPPPSDRSCLFLDVDGSLIDIAPRPESVVVPASLVSDLQRADRRLQGAVALVSGRSVAQLDALFEPLRLRASGVHGAEIRYEPEGATVSEADPIPDAVRAAVHTLVDRHPGAFAEDKSFSMAIHFRAVPSAGPLLAEAMAALLARVGDPSLQLLPGHFVVELKRPTFDKGEAVRRFMTHPRFRGRTPIYVGDDVTDHPGFAVALAEGGAAYGVGKRIPDTTGTFDSPSAVRAWVKSIADQETMPA